MNEVATTQELLFQAIKETIPARVSFIRDISELLEVSYDSVYRLIRGEKEVSLEELKLLSSHYKISVDEFFNFNNSKINFNSLAVCEKGFRFDDWLRAILLDVKNVKSAHEKEIIYATKDIPLFHFFEFPEIAAFKLYFWQKTLFPAGGFHDRLITFDIQPEVFNLGCEIESIYMTIPIREIWNEETITGIFRQIEFCYVSGLFASREDAVRLCDVLDLWLNHVEQEAECGYRFMYGNPATGIQNSFNLYSNEIPLTNNIIMVNLDGIKTIYQTYNVINVLITSNTSFCEQVDESLRIIMQNSTLISGTAAKERNRFFSLLKEKVKVLREKIV
jgi:hypothetical protein